MFEQYEEAQTFLELASSIDPTSVVAWTLLGEMKSIFLLTATTSHYIPLFVKHHMSTGLCLGW